MIRSRLTYANAMSTLAVFLVLAGGTAFAAKQLGKKTVGTKQLKGNAVTKAKIKKNAVTRAKIKANAVNGAKIADGSVTGAEIDAPSTPFSRTVARFRSSASVPFTKARSTRWAGPTPRTPARTTCSPPPSTSRSPPAVNRPGPRPRS